MKNMKDEAPFISIIILTYNSEDTKQACLESMQVGWMNIAFLAPEFLQRLGGGITYVSHANYLIPAHDRKTEQRTGTNTKRTHATGVSFEFVVSSLFIPNFFLPEHKIKQRPLNFCKEKHPRHRTRMTQIRRRDMKVASQIAEYATPSIWGNPTVTCVGSNAGV